MGPFDGIVCYRREHNRAGHRDHSLVPLCAEYKISLEDLARHCSAYPFSLIKLSSLRHFLTHAIRIPKRPDGQLMQYPKFLEDVEVSELLRFFVVSVWVELRRFGKILATSVFIPYLKAEQALVCDN